MKHLKEKDLKLFERKLKRINKQRDLEDSDLNKQKRYGNKKRD